MPPYMFLGGFAIVSSVPVLITAMILISRHMSQKRLSLSSSEKAEIMQRLERIEQAVETSAMEIERIAESNRFVTRLLSEKSESDRARV